MDTDRSGMTTDTTSLPPAPDEIRYLPFDIAEAVCAYARSAVRAAVEPLQHRLIAMQEVLRIKDEAIDVLQAQVATLSQPLPAQMPTSSSSKSSTPRHVSPSRRGAALTQALVMGVRRELRSCRGQYGDAMTRRAGTYLPMPTDGCNTAEQCRQMGLNIGDTITGREHAGRRSDAWHEARLTLLWIGRQECMWLVQTRTHDQPLWTDPEEDGNWELDGRRWRLTPLPVSMETPQ